MTTQLRTDGYCHKCKREFTDKSCTACHRPFDDNAPDPQRVRELRAQHASLERENRELRALDPAAGLDRANRDIVHRLIATLVSLEEAGDPMAANAPLAQMRVSRADSSADPGAATRWARNLNRRINKTITDLIAEYEARVEGTYRPPKREQVRCVKVGCKYAYKRLDRFVGPKGSPIELTHCQNCGNRLTGV